MRPRDLPVGLCLAHVLASWIRPAAFAVPLLAAMHGAADADDMRVRTQSGIVEGVVDADVMSFKGIAYAAPPVGELRWKEPRSPGSWDGTRKADAYGNACIQTPGVSAKAGGDPGPLSEDCLYLNVWTPRTQPAARLPVIVWIHGGAYVFGAGGLPGYNGAPLAKKGAVVINLNYRLGALGFFAHPALERESTGGPANFGLLDQIAALEWVQRNIAAFGGDPGNVTIIGQSAGRRAFSRCFAHRGPGACSTAALP